jgi:hypothetical protein
MQAGFRGALGRGLEAHEVTLEVDGETIRLRFAGDAMAQAVVPALTRLTSVSDAEPASAGFLPPTPPWEASDGGRLGAVRGHNAGDLRTVVDGESGTLTIADIGRRRSVVWAPSAGEMPAWWRAVPLRMILEWTLARPGRHVVHAGAVGVGDRGVLLAGSGHAGKSTVAAVCVQAGMAFVGDDYLLLTGGTPPLVNALYGTARVDRRSLAGLPELARRAGDVDGDEKVLLDLHALHPDRLPARLSVEAVVLPRFDDGTRTRIVPVTAGTALRALAPSTIFQTPDGGEPALRVIADVLRQVPAYELRMGNDLTDVPARIGSLVAAGA